MKRTVEIRLTTDAWEEIVKNSIFTIATYAFFGGLWAYTAYELTLNPVLIAILCVGITAALVRITMSIATIVDHRDVLLYTWHDVPIVDIVIFAMVLPSLTFVLEIETWQSVAVKFGSAVLIAALLIREFIFISKEEQKPLLE